MGHNYIGHDDIGHTYIGPVAVLLGDDGGEGGSIVMVVKGVFEASTGGWVGNAAASAAVPKEDGPADGPWLSTWHRNKQQGHN